MQQGALLEARLPGGHLQYRRAQKLPGGSSGGELICEDPEDDDIVPARRQQAEPENDCKIHLDVCNILIFSFVVSDLLCSSCAVCCSAWCVLVQMLLDMCVPGLC